MEIFDGELRYEQTTFLILIMGNGQAAVQRVKAEIDACATEDAIMGQWRKANINRSPRCMWLCCCG